MFNNKKIGNYIIAILVIAFYCSIGYIFKIDILKIVNIGKNNFSISIIGIIICCVTVYIIDRCFIKLNKNKF